MSEPDEPEQPPPSDREGVGHRLDPDLAASLARGSVPRPDGGERAEPRALTAPRPVRPPLDTRRYVWRLGIFGVVLVAIVSLYQFATHGVGTTGVPVGQHLRAFAAPLASSDLEGRANVSNPTCTLARHDPRALNTCLIVRHTPLVLSFFVTGSSSCVRQVDALQRLAREMRTGSVQFAAIAVHADHKTTAALVRSHHWTIPVAYDRDGDVGGLYAVEICPMAELAYRGGIVADRLIGDRWQTSTELAPAVNALIAHPGGAAAGPK